MSCVCLQQLKTALDALKKLPLAALASLLPSGLPMIPSARLAFRLSASAQVAASLSGQASLLGGIAANAALSSSLSLSAVAKLEALALINASLGINVLAPNAALKISLAIQSANLHLPSIMAILAELLAPLMEVLAELAAMLANLGVVHSVLGLNLLLPGAAAQLSARASAHLALSARLNAGLAVNAGLTANLSAHMRLVAACKALGIGLLGPGGLGNLTAALNIAARIKVPKLNLSLSQLAGLAAVLAQLAALQSTLANLRLPNAMQLLMAALGPFMAAVNAMGSVNLSAAVNASAMTSAKANLSAALAMKASASVSAAASAVAGVNLTGLRLPTIPLFPQLSLLASFSAQFPFGVGLMSGSPCSSCSFGR